MNGQGHPSGIVCKKGICKICDDRRSATTDPKIEVLRVPDERRSEESDRFPEGTLVGLYGGIRMFHVKPEYQPALLAALLEQAGAIRVRALVEKQAEDSGLWFQAQTAPESYLQEQLRLLHSAIERLLPIREEGGE